MKTKSDYLVIAVLVLCCSFLCYLLYSDKCTESKIIGKAPFIIVSYEPYTYQTTSSAVRYKTIDANGNVFYFSEKVEYNSSPRFMLGDTLNKE